MSKLWATVNKILPFSCVDGPGNRLVIFMQGCNFRCLNCHNPYTIGLCQQCGDCVKQCPNHALTICHDKIHWQADACQQCDNCIHACSHHSSPMTYRYHVDDILAMLRKYCLFLNGITISGGEATLQLPFIKQLFEQMKQADDLKHLTCLIDSNGYLPQQGWKKIEHVMDGAMIDIKAWQPHVHKKLTGRNNEPVKQTISYLANIGKLQEIRFLVIPTQTDFQEHIHEITHYLLSLQHNIPIRINAFHHHGVHGIAKTWPPATKQHVEMLATSLMEAGLTHITLPSVYLN